MKKLLEYGAVSLIGLFIPLVIVLIARVLYPAYIPDITPFVVFTTMSGMALPAIYLLGKALRDMWEN